MSKKDLKLNATERLANLEKTVEIISSQIINIVDKFNKLHQVITNDFNNFSNKIDDLEDTIRGIINISNVDTANLNKFKLDLSVAKLEIMVDNFVKSGHLILDNDNVVTNNSFVVIRELDNDGNVVNPRIQYRIGSASLEGLNTELINKKVGEMASIKHGDKEFKVEIMHNYLIKE